MFKKGDVVVCTADVCSKFKISNSCNYTVLEDQSLERNKLHMRRDNGNEIEAIAAYFELKDPEPVQYPEFIKYPKERILRRAPCPQEHQGRLKEDAQNNNYSFVLSSPDALNVQEVKEDLTKKDPLAIIHRDDGTHTFVVHNSIWHKARYTNDSLSEWFDDLLEKYEHGEKFIKTERGNISEIVDCIRDIINTSYENKKETTYKVNIISF